MPKTVLMGVNSRKIGETNQFINIKEEIEKLFLQLGQRIVILM